jgi:capsular polysaccharide transport system permease protein
MIKEITKTKKRRYAIFTVILILFYVEFSIPNKYRSEAKITIESANSATSMVPTWMPTQSGSKESYLLRDYVNSNSMFKKVNESFSLGYEYDNLVLPPHERILTGRSKGDMADIYRGLINYSVSEDSGVISISYDSSNPELSRDVVNFVLEESSKFINSISKKMSSSEVLYYNEHVETYLLEINRLKSELTKIRSSMGVSSPDENAKVLETQIAKLRDKKVSLELELKDKSIILSESSQGLKSIKYQINNVSELIEQEKKKLLQLPKDKTNLSKQYDELVLKIEVYKQMWQAAIIEAKSAKAKASKDIKTFITIQEPTLTSDPVYPNKLYMLMTILMTLLLIYIAVNLALETIRDHKN